MMFDWSFLIPQIAAWAFKLVYLAVVVGTIVVVILDNRNPVKTLAWVLVLMFLPVVGLVLYFFLGRSGRREHIISRKGYNHLMKKPMAEYLAQEATSGPVAYERLISFFRKTVQALPFGGNRVETFTAGQQ